jgi:hypothetical protein
MLIEPKTKGIFNCIGSKQARDKEYQAILPLRGKILNTWEVDSDQVLASNEIHDISVAIHCLFRCYLARNELVCLHQFDRVAA